MGSNDNTIKIKIKAIKCTKTTNWHLICIEFTLKYVILIDYYTVKDTFKMASNDNTIKVEIKARE